MRPPCPKCRSRNIEIVELWEAGMSWLPGDDFYNDSVATQGDPIRVEGNCLSCGHRWKFRGTEQVKPEWFDLKNKGGLK